MAVIDSRAERLGYLSHADAVADLPVIAARRAAGSSAGCLSTAALSGRPPAMDLSSMPIPVLTLISSNHMTVAIAESSTSTHIIAGLERTR